MNLLRIPGSVRVSEHLLCAMAGLLGVLANIAFSPNLSKNETLMLR